MMGNFVRFTKGLADKGKLIPSSEIFNYIESEEQDYYASAYLYNENQAEEFKKTGSVRGIKDVVTNRIWFDFDQADDPTFSQIEAREVISRLEKYGINRNNIEVTTNILKIIFFSVKKIIAEYKNNRIKTIATGWGLSSNNGLNKEGNLSIYLTFNTLKLLSAKSSFWYQKTYQSIIFNIPVT